MPDPLPSPRAELPPALWPAGLPYPQAEGFTQSGPPRAEPIDVMAGPTRLSLAARTAPMNWSFSIWLTQEQQQQFEQWYRNAVETNNGEFYAPWIGRGRVIAFAQAYEYSALGKGWVLSGRVIRTRIDPTICEAHINAVFGAIYRDDGVAPDIYQADITAADIYKDDYPLSLIAANEC